MRKILTYATLVLLLFMMSSREARSQFNILNQIAQQIEGYNSQKTSDSRQPLSTRYTEEHPLIVVTDWSFSPYSFAGDDGTPAGYQIDVIRELFDHLDIPYEIHAMEWHKAKQEVMKGKAHLMMDIVKNDESAKVHYGKKSFCQYKIGIAYNSESHTAQKLTDLHEDDTVFLMRGDYADDYIKHNIRKPIFHVNYLEKDDICEYISASSHRYYVWGLAPLQSQVRSYYGTDNILVNEMLDFPAGNFRFYSQDGQLLDELDELYDRLEKSDVISNLNDDWFNGNPTRSSRSINYLFGIAILVVIAILAVMIFLYNALNRRRKQLDELRHEYRFIAQMSLDLCDCDVIAIDVKDFKVYNIYGELLPDEGVTLQQFEGLIHPDDILIENDARRKVDNGAKEMPQITLRIRHYGKNNEYRTFNVSARINHDRHGNASMLFLSLRDVTDINTEQNELDILVEEFKHMFEKSEVAISFYSLEGDLIQWNKAMSEIFVTDSNKQMYNQLVRTKLFDLPNLRMDVDMDDPESFHVCSIAEYPEINCHHYLEYRIRYVRGKRGLPICYVVICFKKDEERKANMEFLELQKQIETQLSELENLKSKLLYVMEKSKITPFTYDIKEKTFYFAPDRNNYDFAISLQDYNASLVYDGDDDASQLPIDGISQCSQAYHAIRKMYSFCGKEYDKPRWFSVNSVPITDEEGRVTATFGLAKDVTDFVEMQKNLRIESEKARDSVHQKSLFIANMTHELRTPLNAICGFTDILLSLDEKDQKAEYVEIMRQNCHHLIGLIENIIQLSMIDSSGLQTKVDEIDFSNAFKDACQNIFYAYPLPQGVEYELDVPEVELRLSVDFSRIMQILEGFISNAVKYTEHGTIKAGFSFADGTLSVFCSDTGLGIPKSQQNAVFERFVKLNDFVPGTGLGLSVCRTVAEYIGGKIDVASVEGEGSTFTLRVKV